VAGAAAARRSVDLIELGRLAPAAVADMARECVGTDELPVAVDESWNGTPKVGRSSSRR
jgi:hypothetical protein